MVDVVFDVMYIIVVCMKYILYLIIGKEFEDFLFVRNVEKLFNRFLECWVVREGSVEVDFVIEIRCVLERGKSV